MLAELREEFDRGRVYEGTLLAKDAFVYGLCDHASGAVIVDPVPFTVEVLLHELLHRRYPSWSERRVEHEAVRLTSSLTRRQMMHWYRRFQAVKARHRAVNTDDEEDDT
jgi:hypothetical protein